MWSRVSSVIWGGEKKQSSAPSRPIRVGIAGAGPAGLCIAGILAREAPGRFEIDVFERDSRERDQGSGWDIDSNGRNNLRRAGLDPATISRPGNTSMRLYKANCDEPYLVIGLPAPFNRLFPGDPETNRHAMREGLLASLGSRATVRFQCGVTEVRQNASGGATLVSASGEVLGDYDLVIDSCGVSSPIRKFRVPGTEIKEWYTGIVGVMGIIQDPEAELDPELVRRLGQGTLMLIGDRHDGNGAIHLFIQRFGAQEDDHRATFGLMVTREGMTDLALELGVTPSNKATSDAEGKELVEKVKAFLRKEMGERWDPMYRQCVECLTNIAIRPLFMFDPRVTPTTASSLPLICVGDSLHALPPFTGSGGNLALRDAGELATFLVQYALGKDTRELLPAIREIELKCFQRGAKVTEYGESIRKALIRTMKEKELCRSWNLSKFFQGERGWTFLKRIGYVLVCFYMWCHKLSNYGLGPLRPKAKSA